MTPAIGASDPTAAARTSLHSTFPPCRAASVLGGMSGRLNLHGPVYHFGIASATGAVNQSTGSPRILKRAAREGRPWWVSPCDTSHGRVFHSTDNYLLNVKVSSAWASGDARPGVTVNDAMPGPGNVLGESPPSCQQYTAGVNVCQRRRGGGHYSGTPASSSGRPPGCATGAASLPLAPSQSRSSERSRSVTSAPCACARSRVLLSSASRI